MSLVGDFDSYLFCRSDSFILLGDCDVCRTAKVFVVFCIVACNDGSWYCTFRLYMDVLYMDVLYKDLYIHIIYGSIRLYMDVLFPTIRSHTISYL